MLNLRRPSSKDPPKYNVGIAIECRWRVRETGNVRIPMQHVELGFAKNIVFLFKTAAFYFWRWGTLRIGKWRTHDSRIPHLAGFLFETIKVNIGEKCKDTLF